MADNPKTKRPMALNVAYVVVVLGCLVAAVWIIYERQNPVYDGVPSPPTTMPAGGAATMPATMP